MQSTKVGRLSQNRQLLQPNEFHFDLANASFLEKLPFYPWDHNSMKTRLTPSFNWGLTNPKTAAFVFNRNIQGRVWGYFIL